MGARSPKPRLAMLAAIAVAAAALGAAPAASAAKESASVHPAAAAAKPPPAAPGPAAHGPQSAQGVVQSVTTSTVVVKELDGSTVTIPVDAKTRVLVNAKPATLLDIGPGFVANATWTGGKPAQELDAFGSPPASPAAGVVQSVKPAAVVVTAGGSTITIHVDPKTRIVIDGKPAKLARVKPGFILVTSTASLKGNKPAAQLQFLSPG